MVAPNRSRPQMTQRNPPAAQMADEAGGPEGSRSCAGVPVMRSFMGSRSYLRFWSAHSSAESPSAASRDGVQPHTIDVEVVRIHEQLPALIGLVSVQPALSDPFCSIPQNQLDTRDASDPGVNVRITRKRDRQTAA